MISLLVVVQQAFCFKGLLTDRTGVDEEAPEVRAFNVHHHISVAHDLSTQGTLILCLLSRSMFSLVDYIYVFPEVIPFPNLVLRFCALNNIK